MRTNTVHTIYWIPSGATACGGSPCHVSADYENLINQYFTDVAAANGTTSNVYSTDTQYYDATGAISYTSSFAGSYVDQTSAFPNPSNCDDGVDAVCLTDADIEAEIQHVLSVQGWQPGFDNLFVVMTPDGVGSCFDSSAAVCTTTSPHGYCAYHSGYLDSNNHPVLYANEPYDATIPGCTDGTSPNGDDGDATINTISHEHNEAITDPAGNAWYSADGEENGDLCAWDFGAEIAGTVGVDAYNQVINGHHYWLQQEYSNDGSSCAQRYPFEVSTNTALPGVSGAAGVGQVLSATHGTWSQVPTSYTYQWLRCSDATIFSCFTFPGATGPTSTYRLTTGDVGKIFRVGVYATNAVGTSYIAASAPTAVVVPIPTAMGAPVLSGIDAVGNTLSTTAGSWNTSARFTYQWQRCAGDGSGCTAIPAATARTYRLAGSDAGHRLKAVVAATNAAGAGSASSVLTALIAARPHAKSAPRIFGRAKVGKRLRGTHGTWSGPPRTYRYAWLRCSAHGGRCTPIKKATHPTYRLTKQDTQHRLRLRVTAVNVGGRSTATSRASQTVSL
jgi:hypothetical protein